MKHGLITAAIILSILPKSIDAQKFGISFGTDIPYQHYAGVNLQYEHTDYGFRTGILAKPYSGMILNLLEAFGTEDVYINMLESAFRFGWMNGLGASYKFGRNKNWYAGPELRFDFLTASDTPTELVEAATGESILNLYPRFRDGIDIRLGLVMYAAGIRMGRTFQLGENKDHYWVIELSAFKHYATQSLLEINDREADRLNSIVDELLWEDVFKEYGYYGGAGISYNYVF